MGVVRALCCKDDPIDTNFVVWVRLIVHGKLPPLFLLLCNMAGYLKPRHLVIHARCAQRNILDYFCLHVQLESVRQIEPKLNRDARRDSNVGDDWTLTLFSARSRNLACQRESHLLLC